MKPAEITFLRAFAIGSLMGLAACAAPKAGPNAGAEQAAPPGLAEKSAAAATVPTVPPPLATKPSLGAEAAAVAANHVDIDFPEGGAAITPEAAQKLDLAARLFRDASPVVMFTSGHTDKSGDEYANVLLSARRAQAVKEALVARGIPADRLLIQALGETDLANSTDPYAASNRRVTITWRIL